MRMRTKAPSRGAGDGTAKEKEDVLVEKAARMRAVKRLRRRPLGKAEEREEISGEVGGIAGGVT